MERVATKFETIENMIDRMQEVIVALDDKLLNLIGGLIGKLTPYETEGGPTEFYTGNLSFLYPVRSSFLYFYYDTLNTSISGVKSGWTPL